MPVVVLVVVLALAYRVLLSWMSVTSMLILIILFIPIRRYTLPGNLPFQLEPYRLFIIIITLGWVISLLVDPRVRLRRSRFDAPMVMIFFVILASDIANPGRVAYLDKDVMKTLTFQLSYFIVFYLIVSVVRTRKQVDFLVRLLVGGAAIISVFGVIEFNTGYNIFNHLQSFIPLLRSSGPPIIPDRSGRLRVYASAQHPIALGAAMVLLLPLALYLARTSGKRRWWVAMALVLMGSLSTLSRTATLMLIVVVVTLLRLRPELKRFWPAIIPIAAVIHVALPNTLGAMINSFAPKGGLIAEQKERGGHGSGRIANLALGIKAAKDHPLIGVGFGTRVIDGPKANANIIDDQWLGTLLETGFLGIVAWIWLFGTAYRRLAARARMDTTERGWLLSAIAAAVLSFPVGMLTYDAFSFTQVTFFLYILLAFGSVLLVDGEREDREAADAAAAATA